MPGRKIVNYKFKPARAVSYASAVNKVLKEKGIPMTIRSRVWSSLKGKKYSHRTTKRYLGAKSRNTMRRVLRTGIRKFRKKKRQAKGWNKIMFG